MENNMQLKTKTQMTISQQ